MNSDEKELALKKARIEKALEAGGRVEFGKPNVLLIDVDSHEQLKVARDLLARFDRILGVHHVNYTRSKSRHWHLYVHLNEPVSREARVLLQGILGGDPARALLDWDWAIGRGQKSECFLLEVAGAPVKPFDYLGDDHAGLDPKERVPYNPLAFLYDND